MTDYNAIQESIEEAIKTARADLELLVGVGANPDLIAFVQRGIDNLIQASEIVSNYHELEK